MCVQNSRRGKFVPHCPQIWLIIANMQIQKGYTLELHSIYLSKYVIITYI